MIYNKIKHNKSNTAFILLALIGVMAFSSCQKVIDVKLDEADKKLVIDAVLTDQEGGCVIRLSKTKTFKESNDFVGLSGATVIIKDASGTATTIEETTPGIYRHATFKGFSGQTYQLSVTAEGKNYTASSTMPDPVILDSVYLEKQKFFDEEETFSTVVFQDPGGVKNYYLFKQFVNGKRTGNNFLMDDDLSDGKQFRSTLYLFAEDENKIKAGDSVVIRMQCVEKAVYKYWFSYEQSASGSGSSATPANPVTNISGGALGYFSAHTLQRKVLVAK